MKTADLWLTPQEEERFWAKVLTGPGCWPWTGQSEEGHDGNLYGVFRPTKGRSLRAHRVAYYLERGDPGDLLVCHRCDVTICCRPSHLFAGTPVDNTQDMLAKGRAPYAKLTADEVRSIRRRYAQGGISQKQLAEEYGVSNVMVHHIVHRKWWKSI